MVVGLEVDIHSLIPQRGDVVIDGGWAQRVALQVESRGKAGVVEERRDVGYGVVV